MTGKRASKLKKDEMLAMVWEVALYRLYQAYDRGAIAYDFEELYRGRYNDVYGPTEVERFKKCFDKYCLDFIRGKYNKLQEKADMNRKMPDSYQSMRSSAAAGGKYQKK